MKRLSAAAWRFGKFAAWVCFGASQVANLVRIVGGESISPIGQFCSAGIAAGFCFVMAAGTYRGEL